MKLNKEIKLKSNLKFNKNYLKGIKTSLKIPNYSLKKYLSNLVVILILTDYFQMIHYLQTLMKLKHQSNNTSKTISQNNHSLLFYLTLNSIYFINIITP